jgi:hypothetical protein
MTAAMRRFFGVVAQPRTWLNVVYHWLAFPLGLFYFVFLTVGLSLGVSLVVIWVGIPILLVVVGAWWLFAAFERIQAQRLLGVPVAPSLRAWEQHDGVWAKLRGHFGSGSTWLDLLYLVAKLPMGIVSYALSVVAVSTTAWLLAMPFLWYFEVPTMDGTWVPPLWFAALAVPLGVLAFFLWLHALNAWAWVCGKWALVVLGSSGSPMAPSGREALPTVPPLGPVASPVVPGTFGTLPPAPPLVPAVPEPMPPAPPPGPATPPPAGTSTAGGNPAGTRTHPSWTNQLQ